MTDITSKLLSITQTYKAPLRSAYQERFQIVQISNSDSQFMSEANKLHFNLLETNKLLKSLVNLTKQTSLFNNQSLRINELSEQVEDYIKVSQIKLDEIKEIPIANKAAEIIKEILQQRLFSLIKDFQSFLKNRTNTLKANNVKKSEISSVNDVEFTKKDTPSFLEIK